MTKVLVVAAHPDDEVLGCGGTLALHAKAGHEVKVLFLADGEGARRGSEADQDVSGRQQAATAAAKVLGISDVVFKPFPDNQLDTVPLLDITQSVEEVIGSFAPEIVYTHFENDLNIDHELTYRAVVTACRPPAFESVRMIASFEVPSSTEWRPAGTVAGFSPSLFVDISPTLDKKIEAMRCYEREMRPFPHPRSSQALSHLAGTRGAAANMHAAEAFVVVRQCGLPGT